MKVYEGARSLDGGIVIVAGKLPPRHGELTSRGNSPKNRWFESVSLQRTVCLSPDFASVPGKARVFSHCGGRAGRQRRQRHAGPGNMAPRSDGVSVRQYLSTAPTPVRFTMMAAADPGASSRWLHGLAISVNAPRSARLKQSRARSAACARPVADASALAACLRSDRAAGARRGWLG